MGIRNGLSGFVLAGLLVFAAGSVEAEDDKEALARQLFDLANAEQLQQIVAEPLVRAVSNQILNQVKTKLSSEDIELDEKQSDELRAFLGKRYSTLMNEAAANGKEWLVARYVETFSDDELSELTKIYETPVMQRLVTLTPDWTAELAQLGEQYARANIDRVVYEPLKDWLDANVEAE